MKIQLALGVLALFLAACASDSRAGERASARAAEDEAIAAAEKALPVAAGALDGTEVEGGAKWVECPVGGWKYEGWGRVTAPRSDPAAGLEAVRTELVDAGFTDVTQAEGHVTVESGDVTIDFAPPIASAAPDLWRVSFRTGCVAYRGDDEEHVRADQGRELDVQP